ncbi:YifB family Mg chelatase-like AAA ATPase [Propionicicella superfundia]|uniref:YifB family Mg chelatase-like AAA ATPase n=1 Tax=Propionicicella superfundia TaxID=348582 RepID=UPI001B7FA760|nr:YifB family Mg chelatase-like AAA ATPase [Propionicicella superfundia]
MRGVPIEIEAAIGGGLPRTILVGLPDTALYEARDRCRAAVASSGLAWPAQLVTINLSPASLPKTGSHYDVGIVAAVLAASGVVPAELLPATVFLGELGLDGRLRPVRGLLPALLGARAAGLVRAIVPMPQVGEASLVEGMTVWGARSLADMVEILHGRPVPVSAVSAEDTAPAPENAAPGKDLADVSGQPDARWALEVAAAGRHHVFFHGAPGAGKTLLAERLPGILPELGLGEALEVTAIRSLAGLAVEGLSRRPPLSSPHHSASVASLVGGGPRMPMPGAISVAHRGVLFLDEAPEFSPRALEALRVPLESGEVTLSRAAGQVTYPARFQLVLAANPCPCGYATTPGSECRCTPLTIRRYAERLSGPILDRIDIQQQLRPLRRAYLTDERAEPSAAVAERVRLARERQGWRLAGTPWSTNGEVPGAHLRRDLAPREGTDVLDRAVSRGQLSARGVDKVLRVAWTLCDLAGRDQPSGSDVRTALLMRLGHELSSAV